MDTIFRWRQCVQLAVAIAVMIPSESSIAQQGSGPVPTLQEALASGPDLWGEASMKQPNGPSFSFFRDLLPPPRYVHADYRYYPLVLSAPKALVKASLVSNGSGLNIRGGARSWKATGTPVTFRVGPDEFLFGGLRDRLSDPTLANGYLPIVIIEYVHPSPFQSEGAVPLRQEKIKREAEAYRLEAFASTDPTLAPSGVVCVQFTLASGSSGTITLDFDDAPSLKLINGELMNQDGNAVAILDSTWRWERNRAQAKILRGSKSTAFFVTDFRDKKLSIQADADTFDGQRNACVKTWSNELERSVQVHVPEELVNNAYRNQLIQILSIMRGNRINYSALNQYDALYESEGSDAALAALVWGYESDVLDMLKPLFDFKRKGLEYHNAGTKLINLCRYYWQTRDIESVEKLRPRWEPEMRLLLENRTAENGLFPKERYCGDISTQVHSMNVNSKAWRALRDLSEVLKDMGHFEESSKLATIAAEFRTTVLKAIESSVQRSADPPFVPIALNDEEPAHNPITNIRIGSYWNIIIGYTIASGIFPPGTEQETWIPRYQEKFGGICMGMIRSGGAAFNFWTGEHRVNPLYGTRYTLDTLRRDDPDRALVSFYGMLAQGLTRNTFVGGEASTLEPVDAGGRFFYCPPNSAANAHFLSMLRYQLIQDFDLNDDGRPESLRLLFGTSRRWLNDGQSIKMERAPTAFGPISLAVESKLKEGSILIDFDPPKRNQPDSTLIRLRIPEGWQIHSAKANEQVLEVDSRGTINCSHLSEQTRIHVIVGPSSN